MLNKLWRGSTYHAIKKKLFPYRMLPDEFYDALYVTANGATLFVPENLYPVDFAISNLPTGDPVVEIGSFTGMSTNMLCHFLRKHGRKNLLFNTDKWEFEQKEKNYYARVLDVSHEAMKEFIRESFIRNIRLFNHDRLPFTMELFSDEFFECWSSSKSVSDIFGRAVTLGGAISFAYVDGNHQYEYVKRDFENIHRYLVKGGFIFFDDSASFIQSGMRDFMKEMKKNKDYEVVVRNPNYLFKRVR